MRIMRTVQELLKSVNIEEIARKREEEYKIYISRLFGPEMKYKGSPLYTDNREEENIQILKSLADKPIQKSEYYLYVLKHEDDTKEQISPFLLKKKDFENFSRLDFYEYESNSEIVLDKLMQIQYSSLIPALESIDKILAASYIENPILTDSEAFDILIPFLLISAKEGNKEFTRMMTDDSAIHKRYYNDESVEYDHTIYTRLGHMLIPNETIIKRKEELKNKKVQQGNLDELNLLKSIFIAK